MSRKYRERKRLANQSKNWIVVNDQGGVQIYLKALEEDWFWNRGNSRETTVNLYEAARLKKSVAEKIAKSMTKSMEGVVWHNHETGKDQKIVYEAREVYDN